MSAEALALVVVGALLHASWNLLAKKASGGLPFVWLFGLVSLAAALPFGLASWHANSAQLTAAAWLAILGSAVGHAVYGLVLQAGYRAADFSVVYPVARGTGPLFAVLGAILVLGETPGPAGTLGIAAVLLGILLVSGVLRVVRGGGFARTGVLWGSLTGIAIASYTVIDAYAVKTLGLAPVLYYVLGIALRSLILAPQALRRPAVLAAEWRANGPCILAVGVLAPLAYTLVLLALTRAPLSYVAPVRELSMLIGIVLGAGLLRESLAPSRILGTLCFVAGVVLLTRA